jgi:hypothetical protein
MILRHRSSDMRASLIFPAILALCIAQPARAQEKIAVAVPPIVEAAGTIAENVRRECAVEDKIGEEVFRRVSERFPGTGKTPSSGPFPSSDRVIRVTIIGAVGAGGGAWSGAKAITIRADVMQDTKVVHSTVLTRHSSGGVFGGLTGTCPIMDRIAGALGRDVAAWLPPLGVPVKQE